MTRDISNLYALQVVDSALLQATRQYQALDEGRAEQAAAESAKAIWERAERTLHETARDLKDAELELEAVEAKKREFEKKRDGGRIQSWKELQSLEEEVEALGRQRNRLDERILILMDQVEMRRAEEAEARKRHEEAAAAFARKQAAYRREARELAERITKLRAERDLRAAPIPPALLKRYETIRAGKGGVGIARMEGGACGACHTTLPSAIVRRVEEAETLETCPNCGRLLAVPE